jgi:hypothetical protein
MKIIYPFILIFFFMGYCAWGFAYTNEDCIRCHINPNQTQKIIDLKSFNTSIHFESDVGCRDCHTAIIDDSHKKADWALENDVLVSDCSQCHVIENRHGFQAENSPLCHHCHTRHNIRSALDEHSSTHPGNLIKTCSECHPRLTGRINALSFLPSLKISTHEKQDFSINLNDKDCIGCHQGYAVHGTDESINDRNCRTCHFKADNTPALSGKIHPDAYKDPEVMAAGIIQLILFCGVFIFGLFFITRRTEK